MAVSHLHGDFFRVGSWRFVEQGGAGLEELALLVGFIPVFVFGEFVRTFVGGSLEDRLLRTSFGRHRRSVQALVSLCDVAPDMASRRQRAQASPADCSMCVRSGIRVERTSSRLGVPGGVEHGLVLVEMRWEHTGQIWRELSTSHWRGT